MGKSEKVGKMRFYPMLAAWLEFARSVEIRETTLQYDTPIPAPPARAIPSAALRDARPGNPASTLYDN
ncbi:hypothetical protein [Paraburkholderia sp. HP33-1]|uniref:hypothetical protein n=1 Tax=Paraburkholderia sp. HP33-1 TaxID=2883243 RepID=UPI001F1BBD19|nr:hypothetical protein [Paraburkholderia sp. HP33-1]